ncbi:uncharacterized protein LOC134271554 [Saccostrea cucullata]|uniref:uncharacterized protein LOC134271554 n=1 Tax=Saccostrea cuccullata TaxID=36930 RepID=UPI002ED5C970
MRFLLNTIVILLYQIRYIFSNLDIYDYKVVPILTGKITTDQAIFYETNSSAVRCVHKCISTFGCVSVFLTADYVCQGHPIVYEIASPSLISKTGSRYYISKISKAVSCNDLGYIWESSISICYKLHSIERLHSDAFSQCLSDHPNSRLLLISSDSIYNFAANIIDSHSTGPIYLQGTRSSGSNFVDDDGQTITYFRWHPGEPSSSGDYLRTDTDTKLQETSSGTSPYQFICRIYGIF